MQHQKKKRGWIVQLELPLRWDFCKGKLVSHKVSRKGWSVQIGPPPWSWSQIGPPHFPRDVLTANERYILLMLILISDVWRNINLAVRSLLLNERAFCISQAPQSNAMCIFYLHYYVPTLILANIMLPLSYPTTVTIIWWCQGQLCSLDTHTKVTGLSSRINVIIARTIKARST